MATLWEAAAQAYADKLAAEEQAARDNLQVFVGEDVDLPPHTLRHDLGLIFHDGARGLLIGDQGQVRYVVREEGGQITAVGGEIRSLADLGRILTELGNSTVQQKPR